MSNYFRTGPHHYPPLAQAPDAVTIPMGILGIGIAIGMYVWLSRGGVEKLHERKTRASDFG